MAVTREDAEAALRQVMADITANSPAYAVALEAAAASAELGPFYVAIVRKGVAVHRAGDAGLTVDPCRRSMRTGERLTRAEVDAIAGHTWCALCGGEPDA